MKNKINKKIKKQVKKEIKVIKKNKSLIWDIAKKTLGIFLIIIGLTGLILPLMPGWVFIFLGVLLIGNKYLKNLIEETKNSWKSWREARKNKK
ncbi:MAG TPA: hypothetical protein VMZ91_00420 [Candidatus Paceibacterota bacterium]|nr:hypothetical protein [Candidatus Paceibacterota bacterium]